MKALFLTLCLTPLIFQVQQVQADFRIEHETRIGERNHVDKGRRLVLDNDR